jgi:proteic killer suppression protein
LDISFKDSKLAKIFNSEKTLVKAYGQANARKIMRRMTLLEAAETLADVPVTPPTRRHELKGKRKGQYAIDVQQPYRLIIEPVTSRSKKASADLGAVTAIRIIAIEDYH